MSVCLCVGDIQTECLLNNIIDEDFQAVLRPLSIFQSVFIISKFRIISNFITPNNKTYYVKSFIGLFILLSVNCYRFSMQRGILIISKSISILFMLWFDFVYYNVTAVMIYIISAWQSENTVLLMIKIQNVLRVINYNKTDTFFQTKLWNWFHVIGIFAMYVIFTFGVMLTARHPSLGFLVLLFPFLIFDLNIIYASRTLCFISKTLGMWNSKMNCYENEEAIELLERAENYDIIGKSMLNAYKDIIGSFHLAEKVYQYAICYHMLATFMHCLSTVQSWIEFGRLKDGPQILYHPATQIMSLITNVKNIVLLTNVCVAAENFYENVRNTEMLCARTLAKRDSDLRKLCKNVSRYNRSAFRAWSALGARVDATLPLRLLAAVLTYTVVLLQFAFL